MPIIENQEGGEPLFEAALSFDGGIAPEVVTSLSLTAALAFTGSARPVFVYDDEFEPALVFDGGIGGQIEGVPLSIGELEAALSFDGDIDPRTTSNILFQTSLSFGGQIEPLVNAAETFDLNFTIDLIPDGAPPASQRYTERLTVDATEVKIRSWVWNEAAGANFGTLEVELADISQKSLINSASSVKFEIGTWDFVSAFAYETIFETGLAVRTDERFGRPAAPDVFTFIGTPPLEQKLRAAPTVNTIVYDPAKHDLDITEFPVILDTEGNQYETELVALPGMTLRSLLEWVFEDQAGYDDVRTNIPDFPVSRADFAAGRPYMDEVRGIVGVFEPVLREVTEGASDILWITDGTAGHPPGSPAPRSVTVSSLSDLGVAADIERIDAYLMTYHEDRTRYDYSVDRVEPEKVSTAGWGGDFVELTVAETYRDYYVNSQPFTPVRSEIVSQVRTSKYNGLTTINRSTESYRYNRFGNLSSRRLEIEARLPDPANNFNFSLFTARTVDETLRYLPHPFNPRSQYVFSREILEEAYVVTDGENQQLGEDYSRDLLNAYRAGNVIATMAGSFRPVRSIQETVKSIRRDIVRVRITETDYLASLYVEDYEEERAADTSQSSLISEARQMYIPTFEDGGNLAAINVGEVPLPIAIPLVNRILINTQEYPGIASARLIGLDLSLTKGSPAALTGRDAEAYGNFIVEGRRLEGSEGGYFTTLAVKERV